MTDFQYSIIYTTNRHSYIKLQPDNSILFSVPSKFRNNNKLFDQLHLQAQKLLKHHSERKHFVSQDEKGIMLFGEHVERPSFTSENVKDSKQPNKSQQKKVSDFFKTELYNYSIPILDELSQKIDTPYKSLIIKKAKARRGSCSHDQKIMLNLNLVHLPTHYIRYVIAHETAHLIHKHHQKSFRDLVSQLYPDYKQIRKNLKKIVITKVNKNSAS